MKFYIYDFNEYMGDLLLTTDDYEHEISVDMSDTWDEDTETWDEEAGRKKAENAVSAAYPGSTVEFFYI